MAWEAHIKDLAISIRDYLQRNETLTSFDFTINISGRVHDGDMEIYFAVGRYGEEVKADTIEAVLEEFCRRHGWKERHKPLCIGAPEQPKKDSDEILY